MSSVPVNQAQPLEACAPRPSRRSVEEDRAWSQLYAAIGQPSTAEEVVKQLEADPQARQAHLALFLCAKTTLRRQKLAEARNRRIGAFVRMVAAAVVIAPARALGQLLSSSADVAVEMLPPERREPARTRAGALKGDADFSRAKECFAEGASMPVASTDAAPASHGTKAA